ncbi:hypothetical protein COCHEDRAFT_1112356 [Bipolaris maydis C5]|uniref:Uncharacterized protein n=1 Tax=Cochliobolus heterostrophus (strain C5 / ATCC 48332 / race O) TaxID=701091 RepID=M2UJV5_COCH5|nr:hypothetical protein COCHEDRAFT_1112356 [Bipolaris maydis C5]KAH7549131.1 hypothetical protein BM1_10516 [Bipolaris maydis]KAJ5024507.1 hypothetical protein J3E73DRAFT_259502 [Bipolaris maydis]KAJ6195166.1 hypothetical protein J3E72DRAFT_271429 [Bipolaris maydis]KAJ6207234.1 hypothetical protein PSV09DRAFT_1112356 [Bipolaris maydis]
MTSRKARSSILSTLNINIAELVHLNPALNRDDARGVLRAHDDNMECASFYVKIGRICGRFPRIPYPVAEALLLAHNEDWEEVCESFRLLFKTMGIREHTDQATEVATFVGGMPHLVYRRDLLANHFRQKRMATSPRISSITTDDDLFANEDVNLSDIPTTSRFQVAKLQHRHARDCPLREHCDHDRSVYYRTFLSCDDQNEAQMLLLSMHSAY